MLGDTMALDELTLIQRLTRNAPTHAGVVVGPGDDCAVLEVGLPDRWALLKTDAVVEGVHFTAEADPARVGHKALARALSDIAAMAGEPSSAVITLAAPADIPPERLERLYAGLAATARRWNLALVGGETTATSGPLLVSVALLGFVEKGRCLRRRGARPGDALFVTGRLGGSLAGRHLDFEPRIIHARWLAQHFHPHAMIDLSDGLATDLRHLLEADRLGAELLREAIPISRAARERARQPGGRPALEAALADGEDFELLFAIEPSQAVPLLDAWKQRFPALALSCIGRVRQEPGIVLRDHRGGQPMELHGYLHFQQSG